MATCRGVDVSAFQGAQDWAAWKAAGVVFAFAKASEGERSHDATFATHITGIIKAGLVPGAYHFGWPTQDPHAEATNYIGAVKPYAGRGFCHWLDLEHYPDGRNYTGRTALQIREWAATWVAKVSAAFPGQRVGIYTSGDDIAAGHVPDGLPLWYPAYPGTSVDTYVEAEAQAQPRPSGRSPLIWQFTSDPAGAARIDESIAFMSAADFRAWAAETPTPVQEDDMPLWNTGTVTPGPQPTVALSPHGAAWKTAANRRLHLGMDQLSPTPPKASVRVAIHDGTKWRLSTVDLTAAEGTVDVPMTAADEKVSLQTTAAGVSYAIESW